MRLARNTQNTLHIIKLDYIYKLYSTVLQNNKMY